MPRFGSRGLVASGLYQWIGSQLEERAARPHPYDAIDGGTRPVPVPEALRCFRSGRSVMVPAWWLDGHSARGAGFVGVVPAAREFRRPVYVVGPDDVVRPADSEV